MSDWGESLAVMGVDDEAGDLVGLVGNDRLVKKCVEGQIRESILRRDLFLAGFSRHAGQLVATARRRGLGEECPEIAERITAISDRGVVHRGPRWTDAPNAGARPARMRLVVLQDSERTSAGRESTDRVPRASATSIAGSARRTRRWFAPDGASMCCPDTTECGRSRRPRSKSFYFNF